MLIGVPKVLTSRYCMRLQTRVETEKYDFRKGGGQVGSLAPKLCRQFYGVENVLIHLRVEYSKERGSRCDYIVLLQSCFKEY